MSSKNLVILLGRLGQDVEAREGYGTVSLATSSVWKDRNGDRQEKTEWHSLTISERLMSNIGQYLQKGKQVLVEGAIQYTEKEINGRTAKFTNIRVFQITLLGSRDETTAPRTVAPAGSGELTEDDIPF